MAEVDENKMADTPKMAGGEGGHGYIAEPLRGLAVPISTLTLDPANARKHPEKNMEAIKASLTRFGQRAPVVVQRKGMVVRAGNGRVLAAKALGWSHVAAVVVDDDSVDAVAFAIADNRTAELAEWDSETLASLLDTLPKDRLPDTGFTDEDLAELLNGLTPDVTEDEAPEPLPDPVTRTGDLWLLGDHRLLCGDSTKAGDVDAVVGGETPFIMVTDPPYGVEYDPADKDVANGGSKTANSSRGVVTNDDVSDWTDAYKLFGGSVAYVWHGDRSGIAIDVGLNLRSAGLGIRGRVVWAKNKHTFGRGHYHWQHESAWYAVRKGQTSKWVGDATQSTVWSIPTKDGEHTVHGTQKPIECMARPIRNHGGPEDHVYEPFSGSGTTIIACEQLRRKCRAIEIAPVYVDVAVRRWEKLTGKQATLKATGKTWADTAAERGVTVV